MTTENVRSSALALLSFALVVCSSAAIAAPPPAPTVPQLLAKYVAAVDEAGAKPLDRYVASGTLAGDSLTGTFTSWHDGNCNRDDQVLGPRSESVIGCGTGLYLRDSNGNVRELRGILYRRGLTDHFIESGDFAKEPERSTYRGTAKIDGRNTYMLDVTAKGGQTETIYLDAETGLPDRMAYDDDDGRTTVDLSDWRSVNGHRFPFHSVVSNGDRAFDLVGVTTSIVPEAAVPAGTFVPPPSRSIDMPRPATIAVTLRDGHLYVPVTIHGATYNFLIDTGSANVVIDERVAKAAGLKEEGVLQANGAARTGGLHVERLDDLQIGTGHLRDIIVASLDLGSATAGAFHIDGILGFPLFAAATVRLDYAKSQMTFGPPGSIAGEGAKLDLDLDRSIQETSATLNRDVQGQFVLDTGDGAEMLLYKPFVDRHAGIVPITDTSRSSYGVGGATSSYRTTLDWLQIGGISVYHVGVDVMLSTSGAFADRFDAGNIGYGVLKNFILTFDDRSGTLYLERGAAFDDGRSKGG